MPAGQTVMIGGPGILEERRLSAAGELRSSGGRTLHTHIDVDRKTRDTRSEQPHRQPKHVCHRVVS